MICISCSWFNCCNRRLRFFVQFTHIVPWTVFYCHKVCMNILWCSCSILLRLFSKPLLRLFSKPSSELATSWCTFQDDFNRLFSQSEMLKLQTRQLLHKQINWLDYTPLKTNITICKLHIINWQDCSKTLRTTSRYLNYATSTDRTSTWHWKSTSRHVKCILSPNGTHTQRWQSALQNVNFTPHINYYMALDWHANDHIIN